MKSTEKRRRYGLLDVFRGLALISMILYHAMWDLVYVYDVNIPMFPSKISYVWQQSICQSFILLSGFCFVLGKRHFKRGLTIFGASVIVSLVTFIFTPTSRILFGVLTLIGVSMLIMVPLSKVVEKINPYAGGAVSLLLFLLTKRVPSGYLSLWGVKILHLPKWFYANYATAFLGFPPRSFYSSDYFPLVPWFFLFVTGLFLCRVFKKHHLLERLPEVKLSPLEWIGRHSLIIYMLHQPLIYGVLYLVFTLIR